MAEKDKQSGHEVAQKILEIVEALKDRVEGLSSEMGQIREELAAYAKAGAERANEARSAPGRGVAKARGSIRRRSGPEAGPASAKASAVAKASASAKASADRMADEMAGGANDAPKATGKGAATGE